MTYTENMTLSIHYICKNIINKQWTSKILKIALCLLFTSLVASNTAIRWIRYDLPPRGYQWARSHSTLILGKQEVIITNNPSFWARPSSGLLVHSRHILYKLFWFRLGLAKFTKQPDFPNEVSTNIPATAGSRHKEMLHAADYCPLFRPVWVLMTLNKKT